MTVFPGDHQSECQEHFPSSPQTLHAFFINIKLVNIITYSHNHYYDFYHYRLGLAVLELHKNQVRSPASFTQHPFQFHHDHKVHQSVTFSSHSINSLDEHSISILLLMDSYDVSWIKTSEKLETFYFKSLCECMNPVLWDKYLDMNL